MDGEKLAYAFRLLGWEVKRTRKGWKITRRSLEKSF